MGVVINLADRRGELNTQQLLSIATHAGVDMGVKEQHSLL